MSLSFKFKSPEDVYGKIGRDRVRVFEALKNEDEISMCDSFFDFCVTSHSLRDWIKNDKRFSFSKDDIHTICNNYSELKACRDIANSHKHFDFNASRDTLAAYQTVTPMVDLFLNRNGKISTKERDNIDIAIILDDGNILGLWEFMDNVLDTWREVFLRCGIY